MDKTLDEVIRERKGNGQLLKNEGMDLGGIENRVGRSLDDLLRERRMRAKQQQVKKVKQVVREVDEGSEVMSLDGSVQNGFSARGMKREREDAEEGEEERPAKKRGEGGFRVAPTDVVKQLTVQEGYIIEQEVTRQSQMLGKSHAWKIKFKCGLVSVYAEAANKDLAREVAAQEFLQIVRQLDPYPKMPSYQIPEGLWYDQNMVEKLQLKLGELDLPPMRYETLLSRRDNHDYYTTTFYIGDDEFVGQSFSQEYSKLFAAKAAYETYTQAKHPKEKVHIGEPVIGKLEKNDDDVGEFNVKKQESEAVHSLGIGEVESGPPLVPDEVVAACSKTAVGTFPGLEEAEDIYEGIEVDGEPDDF